MPGLTWKRVRKFLICAHCDAQIGVAAYRPLLSWRLDITSHEGYQITPVAGSVQLRIAQQQLADAAPAEELEARWRLDFINRNLQEVIYDLPCPRGHWTLMTEPQIARAIRQSQGEWVKLVEAQYFG
jgi:hypothetical protein